MKNDSLKFINLTDAEQIKFRIQPGLSEKDKAKAAVHFSDFYAITNGKALLYAEDADEVLLLNTKTKRIGVKAVILTTPKGVCFFVCSWQAYLI